VKLISIVKGRSTTEAVEKILENHR